MRSCRSWLQLTWCLRYCWDVKHVFGLWKTEWRILGRLVDEKCSSGGQLTSLFSDCLRSSISGWSSHVKRIVIIYVCKFRGAANVQVNKRYLNMEMFGLWKQARWEAYRIRWSVIISMRNNCDKQTLCKQHIVHFPWGVVLMQLFHLGVTSAHLWSQPIYSTSDWQ